MRDALARRGEQFRSAVTTNRKSAVEWRSALDFPTEFVARESRAADLVIIGPDRLPYDPYRFTDAGALILRIGRPVLLVPPNVRTFTARRIVIAWKDAREARRAVRDWQRGGRTSAVEGRGCLPGSQRSDSRGRARATRRWDCRQHVVAPG